MAAHPDPGLPAALLLFEQEDWYPCHDALEVLWQESLEPRRRSLQALVQIAVAMVHWQRGNRRGATLLWGETLARLYRCDHGLDGAVDLGYLRQQGQHWLQFLQGSDGGTAPPPPRLQPPLAGVPPVRQTSHPGPHKYLW